MSFWKEPCLQGQADAVDEVCKYKYRKRGRRAINGVRNDLEQRAYADRFKYSEFTVMKSQTQDHDLKIVEYMNVSYRIEQHTVPFRIPTFQSGRRSTMHQL